MYLGGENTEPLWNKRANCEVNMTLKLRQRWENSETESAYWNPLNMVMLKIHHIKGREKLNPRWQYSKYL